MNSKSITFLLTYLLLLSFMLVVPAMAWECPRPPPSGCYKCQDGVWVKYGNCWGGCQCNYCFNCWCNWLCLPGQICCDGLTCYDPLTKKCCGDGYGTVCYKDHICCIGRCAIGCCGGENYTIDEYWHNFEPNSPQTCYAWICDGPDGNIKEDNCGNTLEIMCAEPDGTGGVLDCA